jgi:hypothetical protein
MDSEISEMLGSTSCPNQPITPLPLRQRNKRRIFLHPTFTIQSPLADILKVAMSAFEKYTSQNILF